MKWMQSREMELMKSCCHLLEKVRETNLTPNTPLIHTLFTCSKLNVDDFSVLACPLGYVDSTQEVEWNYLHSQEKRQFYNFVYLSMK